MYRRIAVGLLLSGCSLEPKWEARVLPGPGQHITEQAVRSAEYFCTSKATIAANQTVQYPNGGLSGLASHLKEEETRRAAFSLCMAEKGYKIGWRRVN